MNFRTATKHDVPAIVDMLSHDKLGKLREHLPGPVPAAYFEAFDKIAQDPNQELMVIEDDAKSIVGTFQITFIPYLTYQGGMRAQLEAVRVRDDVRGRGLGTQVVAWAIKRAKARNAHLLQLTTDKRRPEAIRFYEKMGFIASHEGMKLHF